MYADKERNLEVSDKENSKGDHPLHTTQGRSLLELLCCGCMSILKEISPQCSLEGMMLKLKLQYFGHLIRRVDSLEKTLMLGGIGGQEDKGTTEDEMAGWHHQLDGPEFG